MEIENISLSLEFFKSLFHFFNPNLILRASKIFGSQFTTRKIIGCSSLKAQPFKVSLDIFFESHLE